MALTWPAKHPAAVQTYSWTPALDAGDTLATATLSVVSGSAEIDAQDVSDGKLIAMLSGGTDGEVTAFYGVATTGSGQTLDETIYLPVQASASTDPNVAALKMRYPAFAAVDDATIAYWLADAAGGSDASWIEGDQQPALLSLAAHRMSVAKVAGIAGNDVSGFAAAGVTDFQSGSFRARFSDEAIKVAVAGGLASTPYGLEYAELLQKNKGGGTVTLPGRVIHAWPCGPTGWGGVFPPYGC